MDETQRRCQRLKAEAHWVARNLGVNINYDKTDGTWFHLLKLPISPGWNYDKVDILLDIPHGTLGYPYTAPGSFWINRGLATNDGRSIDLLPGVAQAVDQEHWNKGWKHVDFHLASWKPQTGAKFVDGDNLLTYLQSIFRFFDEYQQRKAEE